MGGQNVQKIGVIVIVLQILLMLVHQEISRLYKLAKPIVIMTLCVKNWFINIIYVLCIMQEPVEH